MPERHRLLSQMVQHEVLITERVKTALTEKNNPWFLKYGVGFHPNHVYRTDLGYSTIPDLQAGRAIFAHVLGISRHENTFYEDHRYDDPQPVEEDRLLYAEYLEFQLTLLGLLSLEVVIQIRERTWWDLTLESIPDNLLFQRGVELSSFETVVQKALGWKAEGWKIALFHGSFDPVTFTHLQNATQAHSYSRVTGVPIKHIIGFDSDELLRKRKGNSRPRFNLDERRKQFGRFWMVDETVVMRAREPETMEFVRDYEALGVDYVVAIAGGEDLVTRLYPASIVGADIIPIRRSPLPSATELLEGKG